MPKSKNSFLQKFYSVRPAIEMIWDTQRRGSFRNTLPETLLNVHERLTQILSGSAKQRESLTLQSALNISEDAYLKPRAFLTYLYRLHPYALEDDSPESQEINNLLDLAEEDLLRHILRDVNPNPTFLTGGAYRLRLANRISTKTNKSGKIPMSKKNALFRVKDYETELVASNVPPFYYGVPRNDEETRILEIYASLPNSVKELFFANSYRGELNRSLPLYLPREIILFADNERWEALKKASESKSKTAVHAELAKFLLDFLNFEHRVNSFGLGMPTSSRSTDKLTTREQALMNWCKPHKWITKTKHKASDDLDDEPSK